MDELSSPRLSDVEICRIANLDEAFGMSHLDILLRTEEGRETFHEFMMWSLSDKNDLTPKKFGKMAPLMAQVLIEGDISIYDIADKRYEILEKIDERMNIFEMRHCIDLLMEGMTFDNLEIEETFRLHLKEVFVREYCMDLSVRAFAHDSFQEVVSNFSKNRGICLKECPFLGLSKSDFDKRFHEMIRDMVLSTFGEDSPQDPIEKCVAQKYYKRRLRNTKQELWRNTIYAQKIVFDLLKVFPEMHCCWRCRRLHLHCKGKQGKTLICAGCKCAVYCSRQCQVQDWREGKHKECCEKIGLEWSLHEARKRRVGKALRKGRIFTKPIIVNGIERECFLRPSEKLDYFLCRKDSIENARLASMDAFYENVARLACGGTHPIFGDDTISSKLQKEISTPDYEDILSDFDHDSFTEEKITAMLNLAVVLKYQIDVYGRIAASKDFLHCYELSIDHFITLYICYEPLDIHQQTFGYNFYRFSLETELLQKLYLYNKGMGNEDTEKHM
ncbi:predicted protein [Chaetoceros tenuissimus]|uniref:MYND-type domain-containing protein n=1 Tax=Chaetoceros tenuissimus TaxID=426638 RepID=A0AAD3CKM7_9STRA|nr:predicted protein [Chaetoceros tenuissimus]